MDIKEKDLLDEDVKVLGIIENEDGTGDIKLELSGLAESIFSDMAKEKNITIEELIISIITDHVESQK